MPRTMTMTMMPEARAPPPRLVPIRPGGTALGLPTGLLIVGLFPGPVAA